MDLDDMRTVLDSSGVDVWTFIDTAITVAALDDFNELKRRRDGIVEKLYAATLGTRCRNCEVNGVGKSKVGIDKHSIKEEEAEEEEEKEKNHYELHKLHSPYTPQSVDKNHDDEIDPFGGLFDDEQKRILEIKALLDDVDQAEDSLIELLQNLADMDITFQALEETDIGRHVNRFRKHPSNDVRRLVKLLVRKWKATVDEWVNQPGEEDASAALLGADGDSPQQKLPQNGHYKAPDFSHSPNLQNGSLGSERNYSEPEQKVKKVVRNETPPRPVHRASAPAPNQQRQREQQKANNIEADRLASARKRLQESYKEAENAKKQRTIQVMDIHEIPKPKNAFFSKNKAGGSQGRHW